MDEKQARTWAMAAHLSTFIGYLIPFGNILAPLIIWLSKKEESGLIEDQAKESLNFQLSITIYVIVSVILILLILGIFLLVGLAIFDLVIVIVAAIRAYSGEPYRYPLCIRFIK